jgi:hypothetical protein
MRVIGYSLHDSFVCPMINLETDMRVIGYSLHDSFVSPMINLETGMRVIGYSLHDGTSHSDGSKLVDAHKKVK